jgi:F420-non-reducing hydrogenase iron-sulfur subunit
MTVNRKEDSVPKSTAPEVVVYVCQNCIPQGGQLPRQWKQDGLRVVVRHMPCSGKVDGQYMFHVLESGAAGLCIVACPKGDCTLAQGNYRAEIRIRTVQRLLSEIGFDGRRASLLHFSSEDPPEKLGDMVRGVVSEISALGANPIRGGSAVESSST